MKRSDFIKKNLSALALGLFAPVMTKASYVYAETINTKQKNNAMDTKKTAKELLSAYLDNINDTDKLIELFADDATVELPYLNSLGMPWQWKGKEVLYGFFKDLPKTFPGFKFENIRLHINTPDQVFAEYDVNCTVAATGRPYHQTYMGWLVAENGKIKLIHEALDMVQVAKSFFPNGVSDLSREKK